MTSVLIVEDDSSVLMPIVDLLEMEGFTVFTADNGKDALKLVSKEMPDLIVSDIMMPDLDGLGLFEALQKDSLTAVIPFIFLTAKADPADIRAGLGLGADDYLTKPFEASDLLEAIRIRLLKFQRISDAALSTVGREDLDRIFIRDGENCWLIEYDQISHLEADGNYVRIHFDGNKPLIGRTLNSFEERLPKKSFFRANRKQMINLKWVRNIQPWFSGRLQVTLKNDVKVQMSRRASQAFRSLAGI